MYLLGFDVGSSSIKVALANAKGEKVAVQQAPATEMDMDAPQSGWAEQDPETWWKYACEATKELLNKTQVTPSEISAIGIAYQMHGLVTVDQDGAVVRPAIIWCDGRAVEIGDAAFAEMGETYCLSHYLNSPGNFTASKLKWVKENEPDTYAKIHRALLPGDYIAYRMTGELNTTVTGLSEGIFWDFKDHTLATSLFDHYAIDEQLIPDLVENFNHQGSLSVRAATELGLTAGIPITYRAGDQPNNAMALNVLNPGEVAATGGTSGVVYAVVDQTNYDRQSRVNGFAHVNHTKQDPRIGILLCINGAGIQYSWIKKNIAPSDYSYFDLEAEAESVSVGSDGLVITPFGNGAERIFGNKNLGAKMHFLEFNRHHPAHIYRATLEGIAFAFVYGIGIMEQMGLEIKVIRVGNDNLFLSKIFAQTIANLTQANIEILDSTGAVGAALAAGVGVGMFGSVSEATRKVKVIETIKPESEIEAYEKAYQRWKSALEASLDAMV